MRQPLLTQVLHVVCRPSRLVYARFGVNVQRRAQVLVLVLQRVHLSLEAQDERLARVHHHDRLGADLLCPRCVAQSVDGLCHVRPRRGDACNLQRRKDLSDL